MRNLFILTVILFCASFIFSCASTTGGADNDNIAKMDTKDIEKYALKKVEKARLAVFDLTNYEGYDEQKKVNLYENAMELLNDCTAAYTELSVRSKDNEEYKKMVKSIKQEMVLVAKFNPRKVPTNDNK